MFTVSTKKKTLQMYLMKRSVYSWRTGWPFRPEILADRLDHVRRARGHQRVNAGLAAAAFDIIGTARRSSTPRKRDHRDLIGKRG